MIAAIAPSQQCLAQVDDYRAVLERPLTCRLQAISLGQFHGPDYGPGIPSGSSVVIIAASADDLMLRRAALIGQDSSGVARIVPAAQQLLFVEIEANGDVVVLTLFLAVRSTAGIPVVALHQAMIGSVPVLVESAGTCRV